MNRRDEATRRLREDLRRARDKEGVFDKFKGRDVRRIAPEELESREECAYVLAKLDLMVFCIEAQGRDGPDVAWKGSALVALRDARLARNAALKRMEDFPSGRSRTPETNQEQVLVNLGKVMMACLERGWVTSAGFVGDAIALIERQTPKPCVPDEALIAAAAVLKAHRCCDRDDWTIAIVGRYSGEPLAEPYLISGEYTCLLRKDALAVAEEIPKRIVKRRPRP